jgi:phage shock protein PspC (stress-responsive transcriptional regulator)
MNERICRPVSNRMLTGVCQSISEYFEFDAIFLRILFIVLVFIDTSFIVFYMLSTIIIPSENANHYTQPQLFNEFFKDHVFILVSAFFAISFFVFIINFDLPDFFFHLFLPRYILISLLLFITGLAIYRKKVNQRHHQINADMVDTSFDEQRLCLGVFRELAKYFNFDITIIRLYVIMLLCLEMRLIPIFLVLYFIAGLIIQKKRNQ